MKRGRSNSSSETRSSQIPEFADNSSQSLDSADEAVGSIFERLGDSIREKNKNWCKIIEIQSYRKTRDNTIAKKNQKK